VIALAVAMLATLPQAGEVAQPERLTVSEWRRLPSRQRDIMVIGGVEGLILAASGPRGQETGVDRDCLASTTIRKIEQGLMSEQVPEGSMFALALTEAAGCSRS
jgi:hypothetical protein